VNYPFKGLNESCCFARPVGGSHPREVPVSQNTKDGAFCQMFSEGKFTLRSPSFTLTADEEVKHCPRPSSSYKKVSILQYGPACLSLFCLFVTLLKFMFVDIFCVSDGAACNTCLTCHFETIRCDDKRMLYS